MNTGQTIYEQLQEILNKCIELGWNKELFSDGCYVLVDGVYNNKGGRIPMFSFHELFSKDSGIMEFVEWENIYYGDGYGNYKEWHYSKMSAMTAEEKVQYFMSNARVPTK